MKLIKAITTVGLLGAVIYLGLNLYGGSSTVTPASLIKKDPSMLVSDYIDKKAGIAPRGEIQDELSTTNKETGPIDDEDKALTLSAIRDEDKAMKVKADDKPEVATNYATKEVEAKIVDKIQAFYEKAGAVLQEME